MLANSVSQNKAFYMLADKIVQFSHDAQQIFVGQFYWQRKSAKFSDRLSSSLLLPICCWVSYKKQLPACKDIMWLIGAVVCLLAAPRVQLFAGVGNGWLRIALRYH